MTTKRDGSRQTASVIIPVRNGARYLEGVLKAVASQRAPVEVEVLVVDSGSRDGSIEIARRAGARVIEIPPEEFGHGKTRNFAAEQAAGEYLVFLTQDATPPGNDWLATLIAPLSERDKVGLATGPHLPRPDTSPMIGRELRDFFGSFSPDGFLRIDDAVSPKDPGSGFFSNVNAAILRSCWEEVRFREVDYAEDQAFARDAIARGWKKAYVPDAGVLHAHDYPFMRFMRRYFDEYRGLQETTRHIEPFNPARVLLNAQAQVRRDRSHMRELGWSAPRRLIWIGRSARHHLGRSAFSSLGSRAWQLPKGIERVLSLEGRESEDAAPAGGKLPRPIEPRRSARYEFIRRYAQGERSALAPASPNDGSRERLHIAWLIPPFRRGSGGHMTIFNIVRELEFRGHSCSIWVHDQSGTMERPAAVLHREIIEDFTPISAGVFNEFDDWHGSDVAFATGWQTAYPLALLSGCKLKTYLVQDFEPDFYPVSAERAWAEETYRMGFPCICASPWLSKLLGERYGAVAEPFELGVDFDTYRNKGLSRDSETVIFYSRSATPRRATSLGLLALEELRNLRPGVRFIIFGDEAPPAAPFEYEFAGIVEEEALADLYNRATVGLVLSMTNYSRTPKEMMACGLPVVELAHPSVMSVFGRDEGVIALAESEPLAIARRLAELLDDPDRWARQSGAARQFVEGMTWPAAAARIDLKMREWLPERWSSSAQGAGGEPRAAVT
jgi:GT2 family glycosyltransferase/glycosyltransferase involved in cell wall biosynthesis